MVKKLLGVLGGTALVGLGALGITLVILLAIALGSLFWAVVVFYGSMLVHWAFPNLLASLTFLQAFAVGFVLSIVASLLSGRS